MILTWKKFLISILFLPAWAFNFAPKPEEAYFPPASSTPVSDLLAQNSPKSGTSTLSDTIYLPSGETLKLTPYSPIELMIMEEAVLAGVDTELALKIADCESQFRNVPNFKYDGESGRYTAYGIFQITKSTADLTGLNLDRRKIEDNIKMGIHLLKTDGVGHWKESRDCWE